MPIRTLPIAAALAATLVLSVPAADAQTAAPEQTGGAAFGNVGPTGLDVQPGTMLGSALEVTGTVASAANGPVRVERLDAKTRAWTPVARATADEDGRFTAEWASDVPGQHLLRAVPDSHATQAQAASTAPTAQTTVYRATRATWYGPGFWGRRTACGVKLTPTTLGVAHKTMTCGTRLSLFFEGRQIEVPVIDRGPYTKGISLDLTQAAAQQIGMEATTRIGWVRAVPAATPDR
jgi:rare lipoprotein A (peptidoglycan hydrolase)